MNNLDMQSQLINIYKKFNKSDKVTELTLSTQLSYLDINSIWSCRQNYVS
ncbi:hypothetical protein IMSAG013_01278 [Clostridiales bacterium]|nr:hypothetical protein IMSAG013_01278 [Clostridiales bacterium]